jgi:hypothetical protein
VSQNLPDTEFHVFAVCVFIARFFVMILSHILFCCPTFSSSRSSGRTLPERLDSAPHRAFCFAVRA